MTIGSKSGKSHGSGEARRRGADEADFAGEACLRRERVGRGASTGCFMSPPPTVGTGGPDGATAAVRQRPEKVRRTVRRRTRFVGADTAADVAASVTMAAGKPACCDWWIDECGDCCYDVGPLVLLQLWCGVGCGDGVCGVVCEPCPSALTVLLPSSRKLRPRCTSWNALSPSLRSPAPRAGGNCGTVVRSGVGLLHLVPVVCASGSVGSAAGGRRRAGAAGKCRDWPAPE